MRSKRGQNKVRDALSRVTTGAARKNVISVILILKSSVLKVGCVCCSTGWRGHSECDERVQVLQWRLRGIVCRKIYRKQHVSVIMCDGLNSDSFVFTSNLFVLISY